MTAEDVVVAALLVLCLALETCGVLGLILMKSALDRLHFVAFIALFAPVPLAAAVWVHEGAAQASIKATLVLLLLLVSSPVLTHVTARVIVTRTLRSVSRDAQQAPGS